MKDYRAKAEELTDKAKLTLFISGWRIKQLEDAITQALQQAYADGARDSADVADGYYKPGSIHFCGTPDQAVTYVLQHLAATIRIKLGKDPTQ